VKPALLPVGPVFADPILREVSPGEIWFTVVVFLGIVIVSAAMEYFRKAKNRADNDKSPRGPK
jgi:hypothetical protein